MAIAAVMGITPTEVHDTPEFQLGQLGAIIDDTNGTRIYKYLQYDTGSAGAAAVAGEVAYYYTLDGYKNHQVTSDLSDSVEVGAGVIQAVMTDGQYGWFQVSGDHPQTGILHGVCFELQSTLDPSPRGELAGKPIWDNKKNQALRSLVQPLSVHI